MKLGARYSSAGWYATPGVDLSTFGERGWLWDCGAPILIVRYRGVDCIMDGSHRCWHWKATNDTTEHTACVLVVS